MDRAQGTADPCAAAIPAHRVSETKSGASLTLRKYCGSTPLRPRRGRSTTASARLRKLGCFGLQMIALEPGDFAHAGVACWNRDDHWLTWAVPIAYAHRYTDILPVLGGPKNGISLRVLTQIAAAHAVHADFRTGRNCRPSIERIATLSGFSERTVQRARQVLRLLGLATEIVRGRQRTLDERLASHRVGDRGRGWASVYALHNPQVVDRSAANSVAAPHPEGRPLGRPPHVSNYSLTPTGKAREQKPSAPRAKTPHRRYKTPDRKGVLLAVRWRRNPRTPRWAHRYSIAAWSHVLAGPAAHGWTDRDLNQLLVDETGLGRWIANSPSRPILLLAGILNRHENLDDRPAAADDARQLEYDSWRIAGLTCSKCDEHGWILPYAEPAQRCDHRHGTPGQES